MAGAAALKPPRWLTPANKVFILMARLGLSFGGESRVAPRPAPAGRCDVFRLDPL